MSNITVDVDGAFKISGDSPPYTLSDGEELVEFYPSDVPELMMLFSIFLKKSDETTLFGDEEGREDDFIWYTVQPMRTENDVIDVGGVFEIQFSPYPEHDYVLRGRDATSQLPIWAEDIPELLSLFGLFLKESEAPTSTE